MSHRNLPPAEKHDSARCSIRASSCFQTPDLDLQLVRSSGTIASLASSTRNFDFTPGELLAARSVDGYYHIGDIDLRLRETGSTEWKGYSTALQRIPVSPLSAHPGELARYDLRPTLPSDFPLELTRIWTVEDGKLVLRFSLRNPGSKAIEIGALGIPLVFDNIMSGKNLDQAHAVCSFSDPSIALDAGYVQVTRLNGHGPALLVVPDGKTPFEAYNPIPAQRGKDRDATLFHDRTPRNMTFEGFYEWMAATRAYQETEWKGVNEWNPATSIVLAPGEERTVGLRFLVAPEIRAIEKTLAENGRPVAVGFPGYVLPKDQDGQLFLKYPQPVAKIDVEPANALSLAPGSSTSAGWQRSEVHSHTWGRARVTVTYADGLTQSIQYFVTESAADIVRALGQFSFTQQWFDDPADPFHRQPTPSQATTASATRSSARIPASGSPALATKPVPEAGSPPL